ncbi:helix-turn-helix domain-containing protein [Proteus mirabilis]|uniref:helix-turn-helix domain-containing protein n=1 Tax=Proteus mirabilis TaxID=584 RepID=UPI0034D2A96F
MVDDLRRRMALRYLEGRKVSVNETAYLVGFSDPSSFSRAFKRWTGASPRARKAG